LSTFDGIIPHGQGFYIWAKETGPYNLTIPTDARIHDSQSLYKNSINDVDEAVKIYVEGENIKDETFIYFNEYASIGFDNNLDVWKLPGKYLPPTPGNTKPTQIFSIVENDYLACNALPSQAEHVGVQVGFESEMESPFTIYAEGLDNINGYTYIYLEDIVENVLINLREQGSYEFDAATSDPINRFLVHFSQTEIKLGQHGFNELDVWANNKTVYINNEDNYQGEIQVYNVMGQKVYHQQLEGSMNTIGLDSQSGYYFIRVITDQTLQTTKVFIK